MNVPWLFSLFVRLALVVAFSAACLVNARKLGVGGSILMIGAAMLDAGTVLGYAMLRAVPNPTEALFTVMDVFSILFNLGSAVLFLVALILWRTPPPFQSQSQSSSSSFGTTSGP